MQLTTGKKPQPYKVLLYGVPGIGKTTLATLAPKPVIGDCERGSNRINCARYEVNNFDELMQSVQAAINEPECHTFCPDSVTAINKMIELKVCEIFGCSSIGEKKDIFGADYMKVRSLWTDFLFGLDQLTLSGKNVILIGHQEVRRMKDPIHDEYDKMVINVDKKVLEPLVAAMDGVFYYCYEKLKDDKKGKLNATGRRMLITKSLGDHFEAKSRFECDKEIIVTDSATMVEFWRDLK